MSKKYLIQLILLFLVIFLIFIFFQYYKNINKENNSNYSPKINNEKILTNENIIKDMEYSSQDVRGNKYKILSDFGKIDLENPNLIFMTKVNAYIKLKDGDKINISSEFANFDNITFETVFFKNVTILRKNEKITGDKLEFSLEKDVILLSNNILFEKPGFNLKADKVEIDLITKNSKIFMNNLQKKVIALGGKK